jgi:hypothetical protein
MKTIKTGLLIIVIMFSSMVSSSTKPAEDEQGTIAKKIEIMLKYPQFEVNKKMTARVRLIFNKNSEIVVLSVDSKSNEVSKYIKSRLNFSKLTVDGIKKNKVYILPIKLIPYQ